MINFLFIEHNFIHRTFFFTNILHNLPVCFLSICVLPIESKDHKGRHLLFVFILYLLLFVLLFVFMYPLHLEQWHLGGAQKYLSINALILCLLLN